MFSFQALLSTDLSGGYSQGLIHRKVSMSRNSGTRIPLKQTKSARHWRVYSEKERADRHERPVCEQQGGLLADTEAGENAPQQIVRAEGAGDFSQ